MHVMKSSRIALSWVSALLLLVLLVLPLQGCKVDKTPDAFDFVSPSRASPGALVESPPVTISGITVPVLVTITGGEYSINGQPWRVRPGMIRNNQKIRVRVLSSTDSSGEASAKVKVGGVAGTFTVRTINFSGRVEAEAATPLGSASTLADDAATNGKAVYVGGADLGISTDDSVAARALILSYRADAVGALVARVNGVDAGAFTLRPTGGAYATTSLVVSVQEGDAITIATPPNAGASETYLDYVQFADSPFRAVSTLATAADPFASDGVAVAANGDIYVSNWSSISRVTPEGEVSTFVAGLGSSNGSRFDSKGNLFVAEYQANVVHKITPDGIVTDFASGLDGPAGVWIDPDDNVFVSLYGAGFSGTGASVLKITPDGTVSTYATGGGLQDVAGIIGDDNGNIYAANWASGTFFDVTDGNVSLFAQAGVTTNFLCYSHGYIYIPSPGGALVRRLGLDGTVENFIGTADRQIVDGPIASADFERPNSCAMSPDGTILYVMDRERGLLRKVDAGAP